MAFAGMAMIFSMPWPPSVGMNVTLMRSWYACGLKRLKRVAHVVPSAPGLLPAAGMTYVSLICAASETEKRVRRNPRMMYREAFMMKPFQVPASDWNGRVQPAIPMLASGERGAASGWCAFAQGRGERFGEWG